MTLKPVGRGLFDRHGIANTNYRAVVNGAVVQANWSDLQPTAGAPLNFALIDMAINAARQANQNGAKIRLKLRVYCGIQSPGWAKRLDGPPITLHDPQTGALIGTAPRFWTQNFADAYRNLMTHLATRYDAYEPLLVDVVVSQCTTQYAEPFIRQASLSGNRLAYLAAGYTEAQDQAVQHTQIDTHAALWQHTRSSIAFSPFQVIESDGGWHVDETFTEQMMDYARQMLGARAVLGNNSIGDPPDTGPYVAMNAKIKSLGPPIYYQTETPAKIGSWSATLDWAIRQGANYVELNTSYDPDYAIGPLTMYDRALEANPSG